MTSINQFCETLLYIFTYIFNTYFEKQLILKIKCFRILTTTGMWKSKTISSQKYCCFTTSLLKLQLIFPSFVLSVLDEKVFCLEDEIYSSQKFCNKWINYCMEVFLQNIKNMCIGSVYI